MDPYKLKLPKVPQRQDSLRDQLFDLRVIASRLGMYDAADFLGRVAPQQASPKVPFDKHEHCPGCGEGHLAGCPRHESAP